MSKLPIDKSIKNKSKCTGKADFHARHMLEMLLVTLEERMEGEEESMRWKLFFGENDKDSAAVHLQKLVQMLDRLSPPPKPARGSKKSEVVGGGKLSPEEMAMLMEWIKIGETSLQTE